VLVLEEEVQRPPALVGEDAPELRPPHAERGLRRPRVLLRGGVTIGGTRSPRGDGQDRARDGDGHDDGPHPTDAARRPTAPGATDRGYDNSTPGARPSVHRHAGGGGPVVDLASVAANS
jgi:hypothetical protein